jgi:hypothetical protein
MLRRQNGVIDNLVWFLIDIIHFKHCFCMNITSMKTMASNGLWLLSGIKTTQMLAGTVFIVANRCCIFTCCKLYATLQVILLVPWLPCSDTTSSVGLPALCSTCFTNLSASLLYAIATPTLIYHHIAANAAFSVRL